MTRRLNQQQRAAVIEASGCSRRSFLQRGSLAARYIKGTIDPAKVIGPSFQEHAANQLGPYKA